MKHIIPVIIITVLLTAGGVATGQEDCDITSIAATISEQLAEAETLNNLQEIYANFGTALDGCKTGAVEVPQNAIIIERESGSDFIDFHSIGAFYVMDFESDPKHWALGIGVNWDPNVRLYASGSAAGRVINFIPDGDYLVEFSPYSEDNPWKVMIYPFEGEPVLAREWSGGGDRIMDFIGPLEMEAGSYILEYEATTQGDGVLDLWWATPRSNEYVDGVSLNIDSDTSGRQLIDFDGGTYFINILSKDLDWSFSLSKR